MEIELWVPPHISEECIVSKANEWMRKYPDMPPYARFIQDYISSAWPIMWHLKTKNTIIIDGRKAMLRKVEPSEEIERDICPICHNTLSGGHETLSCAHSFHTMCIHRWLRCANTCPVCRTKV